MANPATTTPSAFIRGRAFHGGNVMPMGGSTDQFRLNHPTFSPVPGTSNVVVPEETNHASAGGPEATNETSTYHYAISPYNYKEGDVGKDQFLFLRNGYKDAKSLPPIEKQKYSALSLSMLNYHNLHTGGFIREGCKQRIGEQNATWKLAGIQKTDVNTMRFNNGTTEAVTTVTLTGRHSMPNLALATAVHNIQEGDEIYLVTFKVRKPKDLLRTPRAHLDFVAGVAHGIQVASVAGSTVPRDLLSSSSKSLSSTVLALKKNARKFGEEPTVARIDTTKADALFVPLRASKPPQPPAAKKQRVSAPAPTSNGAKVMHMLDAVQQFKGPSGPIDPKAFSAVMGSDDIEDEDYSWLRVLVATFNGQVPNSALFNGGDIKHVGFVLHIVRGRNEATVEQQQLALQALIPATSGTKYLVSLDKVDKFELGFRNRQRRIL